MQTWHAAQVEKRETAAGAVGGGERRPEMPQHDMKTADLPQLCKLPLRFRSDRRDKQSFGPACEMATAALANDHAKHGGNLERAFRQTKAVRAPARCNQAPEAAEAQVTWVVLQLAAYC